MAGHFNVFRRYQKTALAGLAIMAMLAFFVLPPLLDMDAAGVGSGDAVVVRTSEGDLRESDLARAGRVRRALNQFLMSLQAAATGNPRVQPPLPIDERSVVTTMLLAREAEANGIVVGDAVVNDFLSLWTGDRVTSAQMKEVIVELRERAGVTESDIFKALRMLMLGEQLQTLVMQGASFSGMPPGWRWDAYRKLEQGVNVELVAIVVESLADEVGEPSPAALEKLYAEYSGDLPRARSTTPGFKEPARARYDAIVAAADQFSADADKVVTDEAIAKFYEENKASLYKKVAEPPANGAATKGPDEAGADTEETKKSAEETTPEKEQPADAVPATDTPPPQAKPKDDEKAAPSDGAGSVSGLIRQVAFRQPSDEKDAPEARDTVAPPAESPATEAEAKKPPEAPAAPVTTAAEAQPAEAAATDAPPEVEPLEKVRDDIRKRLVQQEADRKISEIFEKVTAKIAAYSDDVELAIGLGEKVPPQPDVMKLAAEHGLQGIQSEFVTPSQAAAAGGIGGSFQIAFSERFGVQQQPWIDMILPPAAPRFRPVVTRDVAGVRYLSWKAEDRPEFTPQLADIKADVVRVWKLMEARPLAQTRAQEIAASAKDKTLAEAVTGRDGLEAKSAGPFTWLTRGTAPFGSRPVLSNPAGIEMAGEAFMAAVFGLEPGGTTVAFNEPETICYAVRAVSFEPDEATLQTRFRDATLDPRRLAALAESETREAFARWLDTIEKRQGVTWERPPEDE